MYIKIMHAPEPDGRTDDACDDATFFATWALDPAIAAALATTWKGVAKTRITSQAAATPVLSMAASAALASEAAHVPPGDPVELLQPSKHPGRSSECPNARRVATLLSVRVLPQLAAHLFPSQPALCKCCRAYLLRYAAGTAAPDCGRTHRIHVDNADLTLAVCLGGPRATWAGSDLCYFEAAADGGPRPCTPDPEDPAESVLRHVHAPGVGVVHHGEAYHFVEPLRDGERCTLVVQAMFSDEPRSAWKERFLEQLVMGPPPPLAMGASPLLAPGLPLARLDTSSAPTADAPTADAPAADDTPATAALPLAAPAAPPPTLGDLAGWAGVAELASSASLDAEAPLAPLASLLQRGRPALLARLKALGVARLTHRQALANELTRAVREGRVPRGVGELPVDFEAAAAKLPEVARHILLHGVSGGVHGGAPAQQAAALLAALRQPPQPTATMEPPPSPNAPAAAAGAMEHGPAADVSDGTTEGWASARMLSGAPLRQMELLCVSGALDAEQCAALRAAVDARRSLARDSVDKAAEHQLNLTVSELEALVGPSALMALLRLPRVLQEEQRRLAAAPPLVGPVSILPPTPRKDAVPLVREGAAEAGLAGAVSASDEPASAGSAMDGLAAAGSETDEPASAGSFRVEIFVRRYRREERPWIQFHCDRAAYTCNVALADDVLHDGGRLVCVVDGELREIRRNEGEATVHPSSLLHAVSAMRRGVRYSLIIFFHRSHSGCGCCAVR